MLDLPQQKYLVTLVSVGSQFFRNDSFNAYVAWAKKWNLNLSFIILDDLERYNIQVFESQTESIASLIANERGQRIKQAIQAYTQDVWTWNEISSKHNIQMAVQHVQAMYSSNKNFQRHCHNQTFRNLQPKLRRLGISRRGDSRLEVLVQFLIKEIALKSELIRSKNVIGELLPEPENELMIAVYKGKYSPSPLPPNKMFYLIHHDGHAREITTLINDKSEIVYREYKRINRQLLVKLGLVQS